MPLTYFQLWLVRLVGFLPELRRVLACGRPLNGSKAFYHVLADGLMCEQHKRLASSQLAPESRVLAARCFARRLSNFADDAAARWPTAPEQRKYADLRKFLVQIIERHLEKKLVTAAMLGEAVIVSYCVCSVSSGPAAELADRPEPGLQLRFAQTGDDSFAILPKSVDFPGTGAPPADFLGRAWLRPAAALRRRGRRRNHGAGDLPARARAQSRIASAMCSRRGAPPMAVTARTRTGSSSTCSFR